MKKIILLTALLSLSSCNLSQKTVNGNAHQLPKPVGPYQLASSYQNLVFVSGQIGIDPETNTLKKDLREQTKQLLENMKSILENNNSDLEHAIKTTIFLTDLKQFQEVNKIYSEYFSKNYPARSTVQVAALPLGALIEIECVAVKK